MIAKFRDRWERLKESAKRKKSAKMAENADLSVRERIDEDPEAEAVAKDYSRIPHIESLAAMLINPRFDDDEVRRTTIALRGS